MQKSTTTSALPTKSLPVKSLLAGLLISTALVDPLYAASATVTNNNANGADSFLEAAGTTANTNGDTVDFSGPFTINNDPTALIASINVSTVNGGVSLLGNITGAHTLTKTGANTLTLGGTNSFG
jgi:hypothetical protein